MRRGSLTEEGNAMSLLRPPWGGAVRRPKGGTEGGRKRVERYG